MLISATFNLNMMDRMSNQPRPDTTSTAMRQPLLSMRQQAELIDGLVGRCVMSGGSAAVETILIIDDHTVENLVHLANRLRRFSPYEHRIEQMVGGR